MIAHGADPDSVDEQTFAEICVMYHDGLIGNNGILEALGVLTAGHFNMSLPKGKTPFKLKDIIPQSYDYLYPPLTPEQQKEQVNKNLLTYIFNPNAPQHLLKDK